MHAARVYLQRGPHRRVEHGPARHGVDNQPRLVLQRIYRVDDIVIPVQPEPGRRLLAIDPVDRRYLRMRIDVEQPAPQRLHLHLAHGAHGRHQLPVDVARGDPVGIHYGQPPYAGAHQPFGAPASDSAHSEHNHLRGLHRRERVTAKQQFRTLENLLFAISYGHIRRQRYIMLANSASRSEDFFVNSRRKSEPR